MAYGVKLHIWGDYACFTRPEMKVERVSYDIITPSAARGILEAIHWKPAIRWYIDRIYILKPIRFESIYRNELGDCKISATKIKSAIKQNNLYGLSDFFIEEKRAQRATTLLKDVGYVIEAYFELTAKAGIDDSIGKHLDIFNRRARNGQYFHQPCFGNREFPAYFELIENNILPESCMQTESKDLGWMLHDIDFINQAAPKFFRANMINGIVVVPDFYTKEVVK